MHSGKFKCDQYQWRFQSSDKLKDHIDYLHSENLDSSQITQGDSETMYSDSQDKRDKPSKNQDTEKLLVEEESIECNICDSTFR